MKQNKKNKVNFIPYIAALLFLFVFGVATDSSSKEKVNQVSINSEHIDIDECIEDSLEKKSEIDIDARNKVRFVCEGDVAKELYYEVGYGMTSFGVDPINGFALTNKAVHKTPNGSVECHSRRDDIVNGVVLRAYSCELELFAKEDFLAVSGSYKNKMINGSFSDHVLYLKDQFKSKEAIISVEQTKDGVLVEQPSISCVPLTWDSKALHLTYQCQAQDVSQSSVLVYAPRLEVSADE